MKIHKIIYALLIVTVGLSSCGDEFDYLSPVQSVKGSAKLKIVHTAPDQTSALFKIDNVVVSGVSTILSATVTKPTLLSYGSYFPLSEYFTVEAGNRKLTSSFSTADPAVFNDLNQDLTLAADKFYSAYIVGTAPNYSVIYGEDSPVALNTEKTHFRFVNTISNLPAVGYEILVNNVVVDTKTSLTSGVDAFLPFDQTGSTRFTIVLRQKGTTTALSTLSNLNLVRGKIYTIVIRGIHGNTTTALKPALTQFGNN